MTIYVRRMVTVYELKITKNSGELNQSRWRCNEGPCKAPQPQTIVEERIQKGKEEVRIPYREDVSIRLTPHTTVCTKVGFQQTIPRTVEDSKKSENGHKATTRESMFWRDHRSVLQGKVNADRRTEKPLYGMCE